MKLTVLGMFTVEGNPDDLALYTALLCDTLKRMCEANEKKEIGNAISDLMKKMGLDGLESGETE